MKHNVIICLHYSGIMATASRFLTEILLRHTNEYPVCIELKDYIPSADVRPFFLGTRAQMNALFTSLLLPPQTHEGYCITVQEDAVYLEGFDEGGVLYACIDFEARYLLKQRLTHEHATYFRDLFTASLPDVCLTSSPSICNRGLWTWGHVITDVRGYIDNMVRAKLNTLIIWNDHVPINAGEIVQYAHDSNIRLYWGYSWCWDTVCDQFDLNDVQPCIERIVEQYEQTYAQLACDGIYFQSFTELNQDSIGGISIADAVTRLVNGAAGRILAKHPNLDIQFGLHATSVRTKLDLIARTDPRVRIVWEDCGTFPYAYLPEAVDGFDETCDFTRRLLHLRGSSEKFGAVLKGFTCLDWGTFQHLPGPHLMGVSAHDTQQARLMRKKEIWRYVQAYWLRNADCALEMIRLLAHESNGDLCITALVEDGGFECKLHFAVALWAQMLWDCDASLQDLLCDTALRPDVKFD